MNDTSDNTNFWSSFDLNIAAVAITLGHELVEIERDAHPNKGLFVFKHSNGLLEIVDNYYADRLEINPRILLDAVKLLKNRLHASA